MTLTDSERNLMSQALVLAADKYIGFAVDCLGIPGHERIKQQFLRQARDTRYMAILIDDTETIEIQVNRNGTAMSDAAKITTQQFADSIAESLKVKA